MNVLGFRADLEAWRYTDHLKRCAAKLVQHQIIELPENGVKGLFEKKGKGSYTIQFRRGSYFEKPQATKAPAAESAIYEPLRAIGFEDAAIARIVTKYRPELIQTWADITLAAKEKHGSGFFKRSPQAYFLDNLKKAAEGSRTPPDWWLDHRKEEDRRERESKRHVLGLPVSEHAANAEKDKDKAFEEYLRGEAREAVQAIVEQTVKDLQTLGLPAGEIAQRAAERRRQIQNKFRREHPEYGRSPAPAPSRYPERARPPTKRAPVRPFPKPTPPPLGKAGEPHQGTLGLLKLILGPPREYFLAVLQVRGTASRRGRRPHSLLSHEGGASCVDGPEQVKGDISGKARILEMPGILDLFPFWHFLEVLLSEPTTCQAWSAQPSRGIDVMEPSSTSTSRI